ncbi:MAG: hypothetical protein ACOYO1_17950 [Bacteroidales bacterium]
MKKIISILVVLFLISFATIISAQTKSVQKKKVTNTEKTEVLTLISGTIYLPNSVGEGRGEYYFKNSKGTELVSYQIDLPGGSDCFKIVDLQIEEEYLNKNYLVTYKKGSSLNEIIVLNIAKNSENNSTDLLNNSNSKPAIIKLYSKTGTDFGGTPCKSFVLICIQNDDFRGYVYDCSDEYNSITYISGKITNMTVTGKKQMASDGGGGTGLDFTEDKFNLTISSDSTKITYNKVQYKVTKPNYSFTNSLLSGETKNKKIYSSPNINSSVISTIDAKTSKIKLLGIGNFEKNGNDYDIWYKIMINEKEGWIYGGLKL